MKKKNKALTVGLGVTAAAFAVADLACDYAIKRPDPSKKKKPETREMYIKRAEIRRQNNQNLYDLNPEDLTIKSIDGLDMKAWYLPDLTGHGRSEGEYIGFGSFDAKNILLWVDYLINRFGEDIEIILHGISMGAATVLNCNEMSPPDQVKIIIEDCGFTSAEAVMNNTLKDMIGFKFMPIVKLGSLVSKVKAGYFFSESDPLKNMNKAKNPVLFIHGEEDTYVPFEYGKELYDACPTPKDYLWVPNTVHAFSYYNAKDEYEQKVKDFIAKYMDKKEDDVTA